MISIVAFFLIHRASRVINGGQIGRCQGPSSTIATRRLTLRINESRSDFFFRRGEAGAGNRASPSYYPAQ